MASVIHVLLSAGFTPCYLVQNGLRKSSPPSVLHVSLSTVLISVFTLCYGPGLLFRGQLCTFWGESSVTTWYQNGELLVSQAAVRMLPARQLCYEWWRNCGYVRRGNPKKIWQKCADMTHFSSQICQEEVLNWTWDSENSSQCLTARSLSAQSVSLWKPGFNSPWSSCDAC